MWVFEERDGRQMAEESVKLSSSFLIVPFGGQKELLKWVVIHLTSQDDNFRLRKFPLYIADAMGVQALYGVLSFFFLSRLILDENR